MNIMSYFTSSQRDWVPVGLMGIGSLFCVKSIQMTLRHAKSTEFEAPTYHLGAKHPRYHAFRGATLAISAVATLNLIAWTSKLERSQIGFWRLWLIGATTAVGYFGGWWIPKPILGLTTPSWTAERNHIIAATCCCSALMYMFPGFNKN